MRSFSMEINHIKRNFCNGSDIIKTIVKYPGSKWRLAEQIISLFPAHHSYLEPFFGSGAVLFSKPRSNIETVNDLDGDVVNLFSCILKDPEQLSHMLYYTPFSRQVYDESYNSIPTNPFEKAVWFLIRCNMGYGYRTNEYKVGWKRDVQGREKAYAAKDWSSLPERVYEAAERLRGVQIECSPAVELISKYNYKNVLIYCDPPYMAETRSGGTQYKKEMSDQDHETLLKQLLNHSGPVLLSGYHSDLYDSMLADWDYIEITAYAQSLEKKTEVIWANYSIKEKLDENKYSQMSFMQYV